MKIVKILNTQHLNQKENMKNKVEKHTAGLAPSVKKMSLGSQGKPSRS